MMIEDKKVTAFSFSAESNHYFILRERRPVAVDLITWARWFETADRRIARDEVGKATTVSTVFIGCNHQFGKGPPLVFETMVFNGKLDGECQRYSSYDDAEIGHAAMVRKCRKADEP